MKTNKVLLLGQYKRQGIYLVKCKKGESIEQAVKRVYPRTEVVEVLK